MCSKIRENNKMANERIMEGVLALIILILGMSDET